MLKKFKFKRADNSEAFGEPSSEATAGPGNLRTQLHGGYGDRIDIREVPDEDGGPPTGLDAKRVDSARSQKTQKSQDELVLVPHGMYGFKQVRKQPKSSKSLSSKDDVALAEPTKKRTSVFGGFSKKSSEASVDNFTGREKPSYTYRSALGCSVDGILLDSILGLGPAPPRPLQPKGSVSGKQPPEQSPPNPPTPKPSSIISEDPYDEASDAQQSWAAKPESWSRKGKQPDYLAVGDTSEAHSERSNSVSPVDSGIALMADDVPTSKGARNKGKGRALSSASHAPSQLSESPLEEVNRVLALEEALRAEIDKMQQEWETRLEALKVEKAELLERARREQEDMERAQRLQREEEERIAAELARRRECVCCSDSKDPLDFPHRTATETCEHESTTCIECMEAWLTSEFDSKGTEGIKCPECPASLAFDDMQRCADDKTFASYEKILTRNALALLPEFSWCLGPGCDNGQLNSENENFMDCASCGYKQCLQHKVAWHAGETCAAYEYRTSGQKARDEEEKATNEMLDTVSKVCPGTNCGWRIQKIDGCDHMTCRRCKFEFCWECLASHREIKKVGNTAHQDWCKFHSKQLDVAWPFNAHA